jgi:hypothetical protein
MPTFSVVGAIQKSDNIATQDILTLAPSLEVRDSSHSYFQIDANGGIAVVAFGAVSPARLVIVYSDVKVSITVAGSGSATYSGKLLVLLDTSVTGLTITNADPAKNANVQVILGGD